MSGANKGVFAGMLALLLGAGVYLWVDSDTPPARTDAGVTSDGSNAAVTGQKVVSTGSKIIGENRPAEKLQPAGNELTRRSSNELATQSGLNKASAPLQSAPTGSYGRDNGPMLGTEQPIMDGTTQFQLRSVDNQSTGRINVELLYSYDVTATAEDDSEKRAFSDWRDQLPQYATMRAKQVYSGIDIVYYEAEGRHQSDFQVAPGADPLQIAYKISNAGDLEFGPEGGIIVGDENSGAALKLDPPFVYQWHDGVRHRVDSQYIVVDDVITFELGSYDESKPLVLN
jgi:hypothetical protein